MDRDRQPYRQNIDTYVCTFIYINIQAYIHLHKYILLHTYRYIIHTFLHLAHTYIYTYKHAYSVTKTNLKNQTIPHFAQIVNAQTHTLTHPITR